MDASLLVRLRQIVGLGLRSLFFPQECCLCGRWTANPDWSPLCRSCLHSLKPLRRPLCDCCGVPVPGNLLDDGYLCLRCRRHPPGFDRARAWGLYQGNLRELLRRYKFQGHRRLAAPLAERLAEGFARHFQTDSFDLVTPVPLHARRERERGFDQTRLLAQRLSRHLGIPMEGKVIRVKRTDPQFGLDRKSRRRNLAGAFRVRTPERFQDRGVLIVDDIMTTGTTVQELSATLRKSAGAKRIGVLTVARVGRFF